MNIQNHDNFIHVVDSGLLITFNEKIIEEPAQNPEPIPFNANINYVLWGKDNNLPQNVLDVIGKNTISSRCLSFSIDTAFGKGIQYGNWNNINGLDVFERRTDIKVINQFMIDNTINTFLGELLTDIIYWNTAYTEFITNRKQGTQKKIVEINHIDTYFSRLSEMNELGDIEKHIYSSKWNTKNNKTNAKKEDFIISDLLDRTRPINDILIRCGKKPNNQGIISDENINRYIINLFLAYPGRVYYPRADYYSAIDSGWIDFSNNIPKYKAFIMQNQATLKYHIQLPHKYFDNIYARENITTEEDKAARRKKEIEIFDNFIKRPENSGKSIITMYYSNPDGTKSNEVIISPIKSELQGGEYIDDSHEASAQIYTAHGVHPGLIGVVPGSSSDSISGTDKHILIKIQQALLRRVRDLALKPLYLVKRFNNWPDDIDFHIPDFDIDISQTKIVDRQTSSNSQ